MSYTERFGQLMRKGVRPQASIPPRLNRYDCAKCSGHIITIDREHGVTPFALPCSEFATKGCKGDLYSSFYTVTTGIPTFEWRKPTPSEYLEMGASMRSHIDQGGLEIYPIKGAPAQRRLPAKGE